jgi:hypothetical protein
MEILRVSRATNIPRIRDLDITPEQLLRWQRGELIQDVMPHLSAEDREFLISGCTQEEWDKLWEGSEW